MSGATFELPGDWQGVLAEELKAPYVQKLASSVEAERAAHRVYPPREEVFAALALTPFAKTRVVLLGQDPYHGEGQAHGLAFSVREGVPLPPSLSNIFKELQEDLKVPPPTSGSLVPWAKEGVLLLNTVLTVREGEAHSHARHGWERFTDAIIRALARRERPLVFLLWGRAARDKAKLLEGSRHPVLQGVHPSPLSAQGGFFGSRPFSAVNRELTRLGEAPIRWQLP